MFPLLFEIFKDDLGDDVKIWVCLDGDSGILMKLLEAVWDWPKDCEFGILLLLFLFGDGMLMLFIDFDFTILESLNDTEGKGKMWKDCDFESLSVDNLKLLPFVKWDGDNDVLLLLLSSLITFDDSSSSIVEAKLSALLVWEAGVWAYDTTLNFLFTLVKVNTWCCFSLPFIVECEALLDEADELDLTGDEEDVSVWPFGILTKSTDLLVEAVGVLE